MEVDLHIHTIYSDGTCTPKEIFEIAKKKKLKALSITDHDTLDGLKAGMDASKDTGIEFINGTEISSNIGRYEIHILGYFLDLEDKSFVREIGELKNQREERNKKIYAILSKNNVKVDIEKLNKLVTGKIVSRVHIANYLINEGYARDKKEAFDKFLGKKGIAYVPKENFSPFKAVEIIKMNGGMPVLAHPKLITEDDMLLVNLIKDLKNVGLMGMECRYSTFDKKDERRYRKIAKKYDLSITGGSDFHGGNRPGYDIGCAGIDLDNLNIIKEKLGKK